MVGTTDLETLRKEFHRNELMAWESRQKYVDMLKAQEGREDKDLAERYDDACARQRGWWLMFEWANDLFYAGQKTVSGNRIAEKIGEVEKKIGVRLWR